MPAREHLHELVHERVTKAEHDLTTAIHTLKLGSNCPTDTVCFHAQQCVEKYVKALLVFRHVDFPKTHALNRLAQLLPPDASDNLSADERATLTDYAADRRYPGLDRISLKEARQAVALARRVRTTIRRLLPRNSYSGISPQ